VKGIKLNERMQKKGKYHESLLVHFDHESMVVFIGCFIDVPLKVSRVMHLQKGTA
jgi:hypothetical protein